LGFKEIGISIIDLLEFQELGAISCCPLYLFPAKEARKRMPLPSGLGL
jgi:hypothetical protein